MSTTPQEHSPPRSYLSEPAARLDLVKFVIPFLLAALWALVQMWFAIKAQGQEQAEQKATIAEAKQNIATVKTEAQRDREASGNRITALETTVKTTSEDLTEIKGDINVIRQDIKTLLNRR